MSDTPLIRIVDDDPELLASQKMLLETLGWEVITYASGVEFLKHDELKRPGCVVLDMRMPGMTGLEVQEELENRGVTHLSIIFLTASVELDVREHEVNRLKSLVGKLSPRENDVARCIARGLRNKEIARELGIEETTVKMHRQNALIKLDARSSAELVRIFTILDYETGDDPGSEAAL